jgi:hypothetical protein
MSIRQTLNRNPIAVGVICLAAVVVFAVVAWRLWFMRPSTDNPLAQAYFTVDEGDSLFTDDLDRETPFMKDGKEAVRALVYTIDGGEPMTLVLVKLTPEAHRKLTSAGTQAEKRNARIGFPGGTGFELVKRPKTGQWVDATSPEGHEIKKVPDNAKPHVPPSKPR